MFYNVNTQGDLKLELTDLVGNILITKKLDNSKGVVWLNISNLAIGVYNVRLMQNNIGVKYSKLIKK